MLKNKGSVSKMKAFFEIRRKWNKIFNSGYLWVKLQVILFFFTAKHEKWGKSYIRAWKYVEIKNEIDIQIAWVIPKISV